eukprot:TRINITY_DN1055_c0_g1_i2.p1 TRINITY_DN1055_c0_g1~~TRINITY_DN1055_c0_g1_i2.p1  ORF type:complete len:270 (-),score=39.42 TRINITY_DN1055_c0_g1_i2:28-837(-)
MASVAKSPQNQKPKNKSVPPIARDQVEQAVKALVAYEYKSRQEKEQETKELFDPEFMVTLVVGLKKVPNKKSSHKPERIRIPHSLYAHSGVELCLFTKDPQSKYEELLDSKPVDNVKKVLSVTTLRKEYRGYDDRRTLCNSYQLFLADEAVLPLLPKAIGKNFFAKKKQPVPVHLTPGNFADELMRARDSTYLFTTSGPCWNIKVANHHLSVEHMVDNVLAVASYLSSAVPKGFGGIQSLHLKTAESIALPIYHAEYVKPEGSEQKSST